MPLINDPLPTIMAMRSPASSVSTGSGEEGSRRVTTSTTTRLTPSSPPRVKMTPRVTVSNVSASVEEKELEELFCAFGTVLRVDKVDREMAATQVKSNTWL